MNLDINKIIMDKVEEMESSGSIKSLIEDSIEKTIQNTIKQKFESYEIRNALEKQVGDNISDIIKKIGLSAYNSFIADSITKIFETEYKKDLAEKIQTKMNETILKKYDIITLSEIFEKYRKHVNDFVDEDDKTIYENFTCTYKSHSGTISNNINYYNCYFDEEDQSNLDNAKIRISFVSYASNEPVTISSLYINDYDIKTDFLMKYMDDFEAFLFNLWYNKTPIILDTENIDLDENYYDIQGY